MSALPFIEVTVPEVTAPDAAVDGELIAPATTASVSASPASTPVSRPPTLRVVRPRNVRPRAPFVLLVSGLLAAGLVGVLTMQLAKAAGCRVIAIDIDAGRVERAVRLGAHLGLSSEDGQTPVAVKEFTRYGADVAIITAATPSTALFRTSAN